MSRLRTDRLHVALEELSKATREATSALEEMQRERDPLASHIFISRRPYRNAEDTKSGRRHEMAARLSYGKACQFGFRAYAPTSLKARVN